MTGRASEVLISRTVPELRARVAEERASGRTIGLVPTMGALHDGHESLVVRALERCDVAVTSIFVNPKQFGPGEDLDAYPRTLDDDLARLARLGCRHLWLPTVDAMYPDGYCTRVEMDGLTEVLCGVSRPTHFGGVLTVVLKLFNQVGPDVAFFGQKDYQQSVVIRRMTRDLDLPLEVEVCPIVREADGVAMSSRNRYLTPDERSQAVALSEALNAMQAAFSSGSSNAADLTVLGREVIASRPAVEIDYLEIRDGETLELREAAVRAGDVIAVAAFVGKARLIDNHVLV